MTITLHGGFWRDRDWAGIADRDAVNRPSDLSYSVASSTVEIFLNYTDSHDVDEDVKSIARLGGRWTDRNAAGITHKDIVYSPTATIDTVASSTVEIF